MIQKSCKKHRASRRFWT